MKTLFTLLTPCALLACKGALSQVYINENFNTGVPVSWTVSAPVCGNSAGDTTRWTGTQNGWRGQGLGSFSLNGTEFAVVDSDEPGVFCVCNEIMTTPVFDATPSSILYLEFDQYFRYYSGGYADSGQVSVYNGSSWVVLATYTATSGGWNAPSLQTFNITPYINASMQIRFRYKANWDWFWAIDNVRVSEMPLYTAHAPAGEGFILFPNPAGSEVNISRGGNAVTGDAVITVMDPASRILLNKVIDTPTTSIDVSALPEGVYFIVIAEGNLIRREKLLISR